MAEELNLKHAKTLWEAMMGIEGLSLEEKLGHLYRVLTVAELLRKASTLYADPRRGVADVFCTATTDGNQATVIGASSRLRMDCAKCTAGGSRAELKNQTQVAKKLGFDVGAFDEAVSRLCQAMHDEEAAKEKPLPRPFEGCAEHAVFEKLDRLHLRPQFTYAVQKTADKAQLRANECNVKIVKRCKNCEVAGGEATSGGGAFGVTPRLGSVVTDHAALVGLNVPILTPRVLQYARTMLSPHFGGYGEGEEVEVVTQEFPELRVWADVTMSEQCILPTLGPRDTDGINKELSDAGMQGGHLEHADHDEL